MAPSLSDLHVHTREPGDKHKETLETAAQAAIRGGIGQFLAMPNTRPTIDNPAILKRIKKKASKLKNLLNIEFVGAVSKNRQGKELAPLSTMYKCGAIAFSDDGSPIKSKELFKKALIETNKMGSFVVDHCEDPKLSGKGVMNESALSHKLGFLGIPRESEIFCVHRDIEVLKAMPGRLHIAHVSTKEALLLVKKAKKEGLGDRLSCEVCPHHFSLTEKAVKEYGALAKVNPPLRTKRDLEAIYEALADGTIDAIASDHAPHTAKEKELGMLKAPFGLIGLETMFSITITYLVKPKIISLMRAIELLTLGPAHILNQALPKIEPGETANLVLFDHNKTVIFNNFASKSKNTPFLGKTLYGKILATIHKGKIVYTTY